MILTPSFGRVFVSEPDEAGVVPNVMCLRQKL